MTSTSADDQLVAAFQKKFNRSPTFIVRCPGRVNLIGEHIDYNGYGVLPMAVELNVAAAVCPMPDSNQLQLENVSQQYRPYTGDKNSYEIDSGNPQWQHYFLCGYRGMVEWLNMSSAVPNGMLVLVEGTVPPGSGLSSSSALVCCAALVTLRAQTGKDFDLYTRKEIAEMCAKCERHIGTEGGGMDQAISLLAEAGKAKKIDFNPLRSQDVTLPSNAAFFVLHSCVSMNKAASSHFNQRVVECRIAAQWIAKCRGVEQWEQVRKLAELQEVLGNASLTEMETIVRQTLRPQPYTKAEILEQFAVSPDQLASLSLSANTLHVEKFYLHDRAAYVFAEASRVEQFAEICAGKEEKGVLARLGTLMNDSHDQSATLYDCSCPELDELVAACRRNGAVGARLTGAGWGGCVVALVDVANCHSFQKGIQESFYSLDTHRTQMFPSSVFLSRPARGASIRSLQD